MIVSPEQAALFWSRVEVLEDQPDACWKWLAGKNYWGYGYMKIGGVSRRAHRVAYCLFYQLEIPDGLYLLHDCDIRPCCNPFHLYPGTQSENVKQEWRRFRKPARELALYLEQKSTPAGANRRGLSRLARPGLLRGADARHPEVRKAAATSQSLCSRWPWL